MEIKSSPRSRYYSSNLSHTPQTPCNTPAIVAVLAIAPLDKLRGVFCLEHGGSHSVCAQVPDAVDIEAAGGEVGRVGRWSHLANEADCRYRDVVGAGTKCQPDVGRAVVELGVEASSAACIFQAVRRAGSIAVDLERNGWDRFACKGIYTMSGQTMPQSGGGKIRNGRVMGDAVCPGIEGSGGDQEYPERRRTNRACVGRRTPEMRWLRTRGARK